MALKYKKVLIIGATSGIGLAYAEKVVASGSHAVLVGRRKSNLDAFVRQHGSAKATPYIFDITQLAAIPAFISRVTHEHPDLSAVILNAGIQRGFDFTQPSTVDLATLGLEFTTNYLAYVHLTHALIPFLQQQEGDTALIYTSSGLALVPLVKRLNYSASKAALHHFVLSLREQMRTGPGRIKVVEIFPPAVRTELHDARHQPDIENGRMMGMPLGEFAEESWGKLVEGEEQIPVGRVVGMFEGFERVRQEVFQGMVRAMM